MDHQPKCPTLLSRITMAIASTNGNSDIRVFISASNATINTPLGVSLWHYSALPSKQLITDTLEHHNIKAAFQYLCTHRLLCSALVFSHQPSRSSSPLHIYLGAALLVVHQYCTNNDGKFTPIWYTNNIAQCKCRQRCKDTCKPIMVFGESSGVPSSLHNPTREEIIG